MRTTLTLDDDVAAMIERIRKRRGANMKEIVNEALREGLRSMSSPPKNRPAFRTEVVDLGRCLAGSIDNVADLLAVSEGESFR